METITIMASSFTAASSSSSCPHDVAEDLFAISPSQFQKRLTENLVSVFVTLKSGLKEPSFAQSCFSTRQKRRRWLAVCRALGDDPDGKMVKFAWAIDIFESLRDCEDTYGNAKDWLCILLQHWIKNDSEKLVSFLVELVSRKSRRGYRRDYYAGLLRLFEDSVVLEIVTEYGHPPLSALLFWVYMIAGEDTGDGRKIMYARRKEIHAMTIHAKLAWKEENLPLVFWKSHDVKSLEGRILLFCQAQRDVLFLANGEVLLDSEKGCDTKHRIQTAIETSLPFVQQHQRELEMLLPLETVLPNSTCAIQTISFVLKILFDKGVENVVLEKLMESRFFVFWYLNEYDDSGLYDRAIFFNDLKNAPKVFSIGYGLEWRTRMKQCFYQWIYSGVFSQMLRELNSKYDFADHLLEYQCPPDFRFVPTLISLDTIHLLEHVMISDATEKAEKQSKRMEDFPLFAVVKYLGETGERKWKGGYQTWLDAVLESDLLVYEKGNLLSWLHTPFELLFFVDFNTAFDILVHKLNFTRSFAQHMMIMMLLNTSTIFSKFGRGENKALYLHTMEQSLHDWVMDAMHSGYDAPFLNLLKIPVHAVYLISSSSPLWVNTVYANSPFFREDFCHKNAFFSNWDDVWEWIFYCFRKSSRLFSFLEKVVSFYKTQSVWPANFPFEAFLSELARLGCLPFEGLTRLSSRIRLLCRSPYAGSPFIESLRDKLVDIFFTCYQTMSALENVILVLEDVPPEDVPPEDVYEMNQPEVGAITVLRDIVVREVHVWCKQHGQEFCESFSV